MTPLQSESQASGTETASIAEKARALQDWLLSKAGEIETAKRIPDDVVERLADTDLFRMMQPPRFGGLGCTPREAWEAVFEVARGCGSTAWIVALNAANILILSKFSEQAQSEVFHSRKPAIVAMLTGGVGSNITAGRVTGGVMLSGRWRYASGIDIASWAGLLVPLPVGHDGATEPHVVLVPQEAFSIDHSSWNVLGMRGTGSKDITLKSAFIPEHRWMNWCQLQAGEKHPTCPNHELIYDYPLNSVFAMSILAPTLGVASAVAEEFLELVRSRISSGTQQRQIEDKLAQIEVAAGEATMAIMRQSLLDDADLVLNIIRTGRALTPCERAGIRMRLAMAARLSFSAAQKMLSALGGSILPNGSRAERLLRDLHAMNTHFILQSEPIGEAYGRILLGLEPPPGARL